MIASRRESGDAFARWLRHAAARWMLGLMALAFAYELSRAGMKILGTLIPILNGQ